MVSFTPRPLYAPWEETPIPIEEETGVAPYPLWTLWCRGMSVVPVANRTITGRVSDENYEIPPRCEAVWSDR